MMGTGPFAVPTFRSLLDSAHGVAALVTQPPRPKRGRRKEPASPMRDVAQDRGLPILMPEDVNTAPAQDELRALEPELLVVCDFGQILSAQTLSAAPLGGVNLHGSLLPKYRGAAPINWALYHGERETGVTVIHMTRKVDAGPSLVQRTTAIDPDETAGELEMRLAKLGVEAVHEAIGLLAAGQESRAGGLPQDPALATRAPRLKKTDGQVDWTRTAQQIRDQVRAMKPWPGTFTHWKRRGGAPLRLILDQVSTDERPAGGAPPGTVLRAEGRQLLLATGRGTLAIQQVQPAGKRAMTAGELLRGHPIQPGETFGPIIEGP